MDKCVGRFAFQRNFASRKAPLDASSLGKLKGRATGLLADEMGNSEKVIRERYYRSVSRTTADEYFAITPPPPEGYKHLSKLNRWTMSSASAARVLP